MIIIKRILFSMMVSLAVVYVGLILYAYFPVGDGVPAASLAAKEDRFIEVDDMQIRYREWGARRAGEPSIVLIHGFANTLQTFRDLAPELADTYHVIALDMPGFGLSAKPDDRDYSNANQGKLVGDFARALELDQYIIGGHSMGGTHSLHVAVNEPEVVGIIFLNPGIITTGVPAATEYLKFPFPRISAKTFADRQFRENFLKTSYLRPEIITEEVMDEVMIGSLTDDYYPGTTQLMSYYVAGNEVEMLDDVRVPVLIVWGVQDKNKPENEATELQSMLPGSRLVLIDDAAHYVHEEAPVESAQAIEAARDFWAQVR
ncbi:MAG: alpha/beta fold hydrolase [Gammaproteobacteria bacterium]